MNDGALTDSMEAVTALEPSPYSSVTGNWLDEARTKILMEEVFVHRGGIPHEWDHWPDIATLGIPNYYSWVYTALMQGANQSANIEAAEQYRIEAEAWLQLGTPAGS